MEITDPVSQFLTLAKLAQQRTNHEKPLKACFQTRMILVVFDLKLARIILYHIGLRLDWSRKRAN